MEVGQVLSNMLAQNREMIGMALEGLSEEELYKQPNEDSNSIGWLVWHIGRAEDLQVSAMDGSQEIWTEQGINAKFGISADVSGFGHGSKEISAFRAPSIDDLKSYWQAAEEKASGYIASLGPADMDREMPGMGDEGATNVAFYASLVVNEALVHGGQIAYLRGMLKGLGWYF